MRSALAPAPRAAVPGPRAHSPGGRASEEGSALRQTRERGAGEQRPRRAPAALKGRSAGRPLAAIYSPFIPLVRAAGWCLRFVRRPQTQTTPSASLPPRVSLRRDPAQPSYPTLLWPRTPKPEPQTLGHPGVPPDAASGRETEAGEPRVLGDVRAHLHPGRCLPSSRHSPRGGQGPRESVLGFLPPPHPPGPSWFGAADLPQGARRHLRGGLGAERRRTEGAVWLRPSLAAPAIP